MVGVAQLAERRIVVPDAVGSSPISHPIEKNGIGKYPAPVFHCPCVGVSPSGKAPAFDAVITLVRIQPPLPRQNTPQPLKKPQAAQD